MKKAVRSLIAFGVIFVIGAIICVSTFFAMGGDIKNISEMYNGDADFTQKSATVAMKNKNLELNTVSRNLVIEQNTDPSVGDMLIEYYESDRLKLIITESDSTVTLEDDYEFGFKDIFVYPNYVSRKVREIKVLIPMDIDNLALTAMSGNITVSDVKVNGKFTINQSSGKTNVTNVYCTEMESIVTSGYVEIGKVNVTNNINVEITSGNVDIKEANCIDLSVKILSGDFEMETLKASKVIVNILSGTIDIDNIICTAIESEISSGQMEIGKLTADNIKMKVSSGRIEMNIVGSKDDYSQVYDVSSGSLRVDGIKVMQGVINENAPKYINVKVSSGYGDIKFIS